MEKSRSLDLVKNQLLSVFDASADRSEEEAYHAARLYLEFLQRLSPDERQDIRALLHGPEARILEILASEAPAEPPEEADLHLQYNRACSHDPTIGVWLGENGPEPAGP